MELNVLDTSPMGERNPLISRTSLRNLVIFGFLKRQKRSFIVLSDLQLATIDWSTFHVRECCRNSRKGVKD
jgi:hypothetical protein